MTRLVTPQASPGLVMVGINASEMYTCTRDEGDPAPQQHPTLIAATSLTSATLLQTGIFRVPQG